MRYVWWHTRAHKKEANMSTKLCHVGIDYNDIFFSDPRN